MGARVAQKQVVQRRAGCRLPLDRDTGRGPLQRPVGDLRSQGPPQSRGVLDPGPQLPPADPHHGGSARPGQLSKRPTDLALDLTVGRDRAVSSRLLPRIPPADVGAPLSQLGRAQRSQLTQKISDPLGVGAYPSAGGQVLELGLHLGQDLVVEQVRDAAVAQQGVERLGVQAEQLGPALGMGQILLVDQGARVPEQQRVGEGRRLSGDGLDDAHPAGGETLHEVGERGQVVVLLEALARRLHADGEVPELAGGLEQLSGFDPLQPQRRAAPRAGGGHEQGAGCALAEPGREQRCRLDPAAYQGGDLRGVEGDEPAPWETALNRRDLQDDAVVGHDGLRAHPQQLVHPLPDRHRPGLVDAPTQRAVDDDPPAAGLVLIALQDQGLIRRQGAGGPVLLAQQRQQVAAGMSVQPRLREPPPQCPLALRLPGSRLRWQGVLRLTQEDALGEPGGRRPAQPLALPERQTGAAPLSRVDDDAVPRDLADPPARRPQRDDVARAGLVHHLLVELPDPPPPGILRPLGQHDGEHAPVRDRS